MLPILNGCSFKGLSVDKISTVHLNLKCKITRLKLTNQCPKMLIFCVIC